MPVYILGSLTGTLPLTYQFSRLNRRFCYQPPLLLCPFVLLILHDQPVLAIAGDQPVLAIAGEEQVNKSQMIVSHFFFYAFVLFFQYYIKYIPVQNLSITFCEVRISIKWKLNF